jgi:frataxin
MRDAVVMLNRVYQPNFRSHMILMNQSFRCSHNVTFQTFTMSPTSTVMQVRKAIFFHTVASSLRLGVGLHGLIPSNPSTTIGGLSRTMSTRLSPSPALGFMSASTTRRFFQTESEYHTVADETLEDVQDAVEGALEDARVEEFEVVLASGVLTMTLPPHGTWVLNKQTPNRQIWWSSPISGPRRYEYENGEWVFTRDDSHAMTLKQAIADEIFQIYQIQLDLE